MRSVFLLATIATLGIATAGYADPASDPTAPAPVPSPAASSFPDSTRQTYAPSTTEAPPTAPVTTKPLSVPRRTTGQVLVGLGIAHIAAGGAVWGVAANQASGGNCEFCGFYFVAILPLLISGTAMTAVGIPLWVTGAKEVPVTHTAQLYAPRLSIGVGSVGLTAPF